MYDDAARERFVDEPPKRAERTPFERDRARVVHSAALRRLAAKTQVHSATTSDFVRNRLTHSLEVAQVGRELGKSLGCNPDVVDTACLAHDLGHPPFGHNGEFALAEITAEIGGFEGNAQTLRLLTRLESKTLDKRGRSAGLNLTRASLDAATKYPYPRGAAPPAYPPTGAEVGTHTREGAGARPMYTPTAAEHSRATVEGAAAPPVKPGSSVEGHLVPAGSEKGSLLAAVGVGGSPAAAAPGKYGVYAEDREIFDWMRIGAPEGRPCLEAQVMDWSDDVAYSVHDLEDGIQLHQIDLELLLAWSARREVFATTRARYVPRASDDELAAALDRLIERPWWPRSYDGSRRDLAMLKNLTSHLVGRFCTAAEAATKAEYGPGPLTRYAADLVVPLPTRLEVAVLKGIAAHYVMFVDERRPRLDEERALISELVAAVVKGPPATLEAAFRSDWDTATDDGARLRVAVDQVASLTDVSAREWHQRLCG